MGPPGGGDTTDWGGVRQLVDQQEATHRKILSTRLARVKTQLREKYVEENREVKRSIRADKRRWLDDITSEAEEAARGQHMKTLCGLGVFMQ